MSEENEVEDVSEEEEVTLSLVLKEKRVTLVDEKGVKNRYLVRELSGPSRDKFVSFIGNQMKPGPDGRPTSYKQDGIMTKLIAMSLWTVDGKGVPEIEIASWPSSTQVVLFQMAQKLSCLGDQAGDAAKKV